MSKKILASIMTFIIFATILCKIPVFAAITYLDADGVTQSVDNATQITSELTTWTGWVYATGDITIETRVEISGDVHLILCDNCNLTCNTGIHVSEANSFAIYAQSDDENKGYLIANSTSTTATGDENKAGIGGNNKESNGSITINGGKIDVNAIETKTDLWGAGIGSGYAANSSNITINGGDITATSNTGPGIGGGASDQNHGIMITKNIAINGGKITATSYYGAGIGGGYLGDTKDIIITGGEITATSTQGAGIGSGHGGSAKNTTISNSTIEATSTQGAGIGSGVKGSAEGITINSGKINATSSWGAGIGGGREGIANGITINSGEITATVGRGGPGAGIGAGYLGSASNITIKDGTITATAFGGAGIGGGFSGIGNNITISGGKVKATSTGTSADDSDIVVQGAGIGDGSNKGDLETHSTGFYTELEGVKGTAIIEAKTITDQSEKENWQGIIHMTDDKEWVIGGEQSYDQDIEVENGGTMIINADTNFTQQASLTNNGTIKIPAGSKILCSDTFTNGETGKANIDGELNVTGTANWNGTEVTGSGKITPTTAKIPTTLTMKENLDKVHDGQPADIGALNEIYSVYGEDGAGELSIVYKKDGVTLSEAPTAVGNYSLTASASEGNFYKAAPEKTTNYRITKNIPGVTPPKAIGGLVFDNTEKVLIEAGSATGGTLMYSLDGTKYSANLPTATDAGDYTVYYKVESDETYEGTEAESIPAKIAKATPKITKDPAVIANLSYTGKPQELITAGTTDGGQLMYKLEDSEYSLTIPTGMNAKEYTVHFKINGGDNYNDTESKTLVITIAKANPEFETKPSAKANLVYSGNEQQLIEAGEAKENQGHIEYKKDDGDYSENISVATDAGTYNIFYKIIGDENYNDSLEESFEVEISKADPKVITPKAKEESLVYTGASQELIEAGKILNLNGEQIGNFKYTVNGQASNDAVPKGTETGKYEIHYKSEFLGDKNYNSVADEGDFTVIIYGAKQDAPVAPQMQKRTQNSIELKIIEANENSSKAEYKIGNGNWQDSNVFKNLTQNKEYTFVARYAAAEDGSYAASDASKETKIRTLRSLKGSSQENNSDNNHNGGSDYTDDDNQSTEDDNNKEENGNKNDSSNVQDANKNLQISDGETKKFKYENGTANVTLNKSDNIFEIKIFDENGNMLNIHDEIILVIPCESSKSGTVAAQINSDNTRKIIRKSIVRDGKIYLPIKTSGKFEIVDNSKIFHDVSVNNWAHDAVAFVSSHELFAGTAPNIFEPKTSMSRAMLTKVLHNLEDNPYQVFEKIFSDVNSFDWFAEAVTWASKNNFILGYDDKKFGPNDNITREQLATILYRYFGENESVDADLSFADANQISDYALKAMKWAVKYGIIQGKGNNILDPKGLATRAEVAQMFQNLLLNLFYR